MFRLVAGAYERRSLAGGSPWPFEQWNRFLPEQTTAVSILDRLMQRATVIITARQSYRMKTPNTERRTTNHNQKYLRGADCRLATSGGDISLADYKRRFAVRIFG